MSNRANLLAGVILLVLAATVLWWLFRPSGSGSDETGPAGKSAIRAEGQAGRGSEASGRGHASKTIRTLPESAPDPTHTPDQLKDFLLPTFSVTNATLEDALDQLFGIYHQVCSETGEQPVPFSYSINGQPGGPLTVTSKASFLAALRTLANFSGCDLTRDGAHLTFTATAPDPSAPRITKSLKVPPTFQKDLLSLVDTRKADLFANLTEQMRDFHMLSQGSSATFLPASATLVMKASVAEHARFASFFEEVLNQAPVMFRTRQKTIEGTVPIELPGPAGSTPGAVTLLTEAEATDFVRRANEHPDSGLVTQPVVVSRAGQPATIETTKEYESPSQLAKDVDGAPGSAGTGFFPTNPEPTWVGHRAEIVADGFGFANRARATFENRSLDKPGATGGQLPSIHRSRNESTVTLHGTDWYVLHEIEPDGTYRYTLLNIQRVDPSGKPVEPTE